MSFILSAIQQSDQTPKRLDEIMTTHTSTESGATQCDRILSLLEQAAGEWVAMPFLALKSGSYNVHSRISDLRKRGFLIEQKSVIEKGSTKSFYKLERKEDAA